MWLADNYITFNVIKQKMLLTFKNTTLSLRKVVDNYLEINSIYLKTKFYIWSFFLNNILGD
jgi:hypothetical protein